MPRRSPRRQGPPRSSPRPQPSRTARSAATDRAIVTDGDLTRSGKALVSDAFTIKCTNTNSQVVLKARYEVVDKNVVLETLTSQAGDPVDKILFHRVSRG